MTIQTPEEFLYELGLVGENIRWNGKLLAMITERDAAIRAEERAKIRAEYWLAPKSARAAPVIPMTQSGLVATLYLELSRQSYTMTDCPTGDAPNQVIYDDRLDLDQLAAAIIRVWVLESS